jgi:hypothetical protein
VDAAEVGAFFAQRFLILILYAILLNYTWENYPKGES